MSERPAVTANDALRFLLELATLADLGRPVAPAGLGTAASVHDAGPTSGSGGS